MEEGCLKSNKTGLMVRGLDRLHENLNFIASLVQEGCG